MENAIGFISIGTLVVINLILAAFSYGKLNQSVSDLCRRVERLESRVLGPPPEQGK